MGHLTVKNYQRLYERMDRFVPGVYDSEHFYNILKVLFTDEEAALCSVLRLIPSPAEKIAVLWNKPVDETVEILTRLSRKGLIYLSKVGDTALYALAIPVLGFFEFSLMRTDGVFDQKLLAELYHKYINEDDRFIKKYTAVDPPFARTYVQEDALPECSEVLPYERATSVIDSATAISVGMCFCRHKMEHLGKACAAPMDACLTFNGMAESLIQNGIARKITREEAHAILDRCVESGLAQIGDNVQQKTSIICNCCGCCCDLLLGYKRLGHRHIITPSNYQAVIAAPECTSCGECVKRCPAEAIAMANGGPTVNADWCLGCGVCIRFCPTGACSLRPRKRKPFVPLDLFERLALSAIYQGKLGNFFFDDQSSRLHRVLRIVVNVGVRIPPFRQLLMNRRIISYLLATFARAKNFKTSHA